MKRQQGLTLVGLIFVGIVIAMLAVLLMKVVPAYIEYYTILKNVNAVVKSGEAKGASVSDIRKYYDRRQQIDDTTSVTGKDLDIGKEGGEVVIGFSYAKKINLFHNVNLCIDFEGSSSPSKSASAP